MLSKLLAFLERKNKTAPYHCVFEFQKKGIAVALINTAKTELERLVYVALEEGESHESTLANFIKDNKLTGASCSIILTPNDYRLLFLDAPKLPESEWRQAVPWLCKDVIATSLEEVAIDAFKLPAKPKQPQKIFAVISKKAELINLQNRVTPLGLTLETITIAELAYASILKQLCPQSPCALLFGHLKLTFFDQGLVAYSRTLIEAETHSEAVEKADHIPGEIQNSLNFYQSTLNDQLPEQLYLLPELGAEKALCQHLEEKVFIPAKTIPTEDIIPETFKLSPNDQARCLLVYGQALNWLSPQTDESATPATEEAPDATER